MQNVFVGRGGGSGNFMGRGNFGGGGGNFGRGGNFGGRGNSFEFPKMCFAAPCSANTWLVFCLLKWRFLFLMQEAMVAVAVVVAAGAEEALGVEMATMDLVMVSGGF